MIELLITVAIFLALGAVVLPVAGNFYTSSSLEQESNNLLTTLRYARTRSFARVNAAAHGVNFEPSAAPPRYTLYQGASYAVRDTSYDFVTTLPAGYTLAVSGASDFNFPAGQALPVTATTITITQPAQGSRQITINKFGGIYEN